MWQVGREWHYRHCWLYWFTGYSYARFIGGRTGLPADPLLVADARREVAEPDFDDLLLDTELPA